MVASYRDVLSVPGAYRLMSTALLARLPQAMAPLAVLLLVRGATHSYAAAGFATGAYAFANAGCAPVQGRLVDRLGRAWVLIPSALGMAASLAGLTASASGGGSAGVVIVLSGLAGALAPPVAPAVRALFGEVFEDAGVRERAYALDSVLQEVAWATGPLVVALVITIASAAAAVMLLAVLYVLGTSLFVRSPLARGPGRARIGDERRSALASADLRALLAPIALMGVGLGAVEVGLPALALHAGSRPASGLFLTVWSVGSMAGGLWYGARAWGGGLVHRYRALMLLAVALTAPLIFARSVPAGIVGSLLAGLTIAPIFSCQYALVGRAASAGTANESFTWVASALIGGVALGSALGGATVAPAGVSGPFLVACVASALAASVAFRISDPVPQLAS
ncbi:MAG TPA: MFS transporter [Solirubrobacteraceae bacterium]|jgi:MFS family permease